MGVSGRTHTLPAPTDSLIDSVVEDSVTTEDEETITDISRGTERTSATIPADGSPVTIATDSKKRIGKASRSNNRSQASLLIEFYEGVDETGPNRRPSLRVRVGPSKNKGKISTDGHLVISQPGSRAASSTYRIPLTSKTLHQHTAEEKSVLDDSELGAPNRSAPIDIEIGDRESDISLRTASPEPRQYVLGSDVSSMPPDSLLGPVQSRARFVPPADSSILSKSEEQPSFVWEMPQSVVSDMPESASDLKPPVYPREQNSSRERLTQKAIEKISNRERTTGKSRSHKSRSAGGDVVATSSGERRRKSSRSYGEESALSTGTDPSLLSNSALSAGARSVGHESAVSNNSNITNPKLLQTVEDAIRRLILPELKEIKRTNSKRHAESYEYNSESENSIAREKAAARRISSGSRSRRRASKGSGSGSRHHSRNYADVDYDSVSDISSPRKESASSLSEGFHQGNRSGHRARNLAAGALAGTAAAAALRHQGSSSTIDQEDEKERRRRRKRSRSRSSKSVRVNESEEIFEKHDVPPMPFRSEVDSDLTRSSLLSSNTAETTTPTQHDIQEVVHDSTDLHTPTRAAGDIRHSLGLHHRNFSEHDLNVTKPSHEDDNDSVGSPDADYTPETVREESFSTHHLLDDPERLKLYERNLHQQHPIRRGLSPIQSVASYATTEPTRNSVAHQRSVDSIASTKRRQQALREEVSMESFSSASPVVRKHTRTQSDDVEDVSELSYGQATRDLHHDHSYDGRHRESYTSSEDPKVDLRHLTSYTDDSRESAYLRDISTAKPVKGIGANPEYIDTPPGVESAVASLVSQSALESNESPRHSVVESNQSRASQRSAVREAATAKTGSPLKEHTMVGSPESRGLSGQRDLAPPSPARSYIEDREDVLSTPVERKEEAVSPESEIVTNPSIIQGPMGGLSASNRDHWPYAPTPDREMASFPARQALERDLQMHVPELMPEALNVSQRNPYNQKTDAYTPVIPSSTPPANKIDEGYATADTMRSAKHERAFTPDDIDMQDPFSAKRNQYVSGLSQGMSPLYDAATGRGRDRIQSKDILALMDHLTVRDAHRNARDTEILVTLVQTAAEMRNSLEDVKKFIAEQGDFIVSSSEQQHEKTQKIIGGPRPQPQVAIRDTQRSIPLQEDMPAKRRNIFKRALQSLGSKNETELQNIERMFEQLLDQMMEIRLNQIGQAPTNGTPVSYKTASASIGSAEHARLPTDPGYEPEGQAGTSSTGDRSGSFSANTSRQADYRTSNRSEQANRVSTVLEGNEEEDDDDDEEELDDPETPRASPGAEQRYRQARGHSAPIENTPKMTSRLSQPWADDSIPHHAYEPPSAGRKHKSNTLSIFGKGVMSRWSKTTASTMPDNRYSTQRGNPHPMDEYGGDQYDARADEYQHDEYREHENRPPSPLVPSQVSDNPKYQGYRNSQNLQHPQPRQGPTGRHQYTLENEARTYDDQFSPTSQSSSQWETQMGTSRDPNAITQYAPQPPLSPISDGGYSETSNRSSRRSQVRSKIVNDEPLFPHRGSKGTMSPSTYLDQVKAARAGSPAFDKSPIGALRSQDGPQRKPSGPRPLSSSGNRTSGRYVTGDLNGIKKTRFRGSPNQIDSREDLTG